MSEPLELLEVVKILCFQFRGGLANIKHTIIYPGSGPSLEKIALRLGGLANIKHTIIYPGSGPSIEKIALRLAE
jgi:hypothetical protein